VKEVSQVNLAGIFVKIVGQEGILIFYKTESCAKQIVWKIFIYNLQLHITFIDSTGNDAPQEETNDRFYSDFSKDCKLCWQNSYRDLIIDRLPEYRVFVSSGFVGIISRCQNEAGFRLVHPGSGEIAVLQARALYVNYSLRPDRHLQDHPHCGVKLHRRQEHHIIILLFAAFSDRCEKFVSVKEIKSDKWKVISI